MAKSIDSLNRRPALRACRNMEKSFITLVQEERARQILKEGFGAEHDDEHEDGELARASACYALAGFWRGQYKAIITDNLQPQIGKMLMAGMRIWPWDKAWWKPTPDDRQRELIKAAALLYAEWDRLERLRIIKESISEREEP